MSSGDDIRSFAVAVQQNEAALRSLALRLSGNTADAEDLVQDSLERALRHASRFRPGSNLRAWLCSILHHRFIDQCRTRACGRSVELPLESLEDSLAAPVEEELPPWATISPEQFREALSALPEPFQSAYRLHALEQVSYDEIATRLSIPRNTVGTRLLRARRKLLELLKRSLASRSG